MRRNRRSINRYNILPHLKPEQKLKVCLSANRTLRAYDASARYHDLGRLLQLIRDFRISNDSVFLSAISQNTVSQHWIFFLQVERYSARMAFYVELPQVQ